MTERNVSSGRSNDFVASRTSSSLLERARLRDQAAWERIVRLYSPLVYRWCRGFGLQEADAADVGQEVFRAVARNLAGFRKEADRGSFRGWLKTLTRTKVADFFRNKKHMPDGRGGSEALLALHRLEEKTCDNQATISEETQLLHTRALEFIRGEFNPTHWQAFYRTAVDGQAAEQAAQELAITRQVVYNARSRILRRLREEFAELLEEPAELPETISRAAPEQQ